MNKKIYKVLFIPGILRNKLRWKIDKKKLNKIGCNATIGRDYSLRNEDCISIGDNFSGGKDIKIHAWKVEDKDPIIEIGNNVTITDGCYISACNKVEIKDGVLLGVNAFVTDNQHGNTTKEDMKLMPNKRKIRSKGPVIIEKNVWIGRNVCIMPSVVIGEGSIVGANSVVTHDVPPYSIVGGVPARIIKEIRN